MALTPEQIVAKAPTREHSHQTAYFVALRQLNDPITRCIYAIPNGGERNRAVAARLKAEGVKAGVPDVHVPVARRGYHSLYIEMKIPGREGQKQGGRSDVQIEMGGLLEEQGHCVVVCYGWEHALRVTVRYLEV